MAGVCGLPPDELEHFRWRVFGERHKIAGFCISCMIHGFNAYITCSFNYNIYQSSGMAAATCSRGNFCKMGKIMVLLVMLETAATLYAPYFRRCRVHRGGVDADAVPIEDL